MIKDISFEDLENKYKNGIVFLGCGGSLDEWVECVSESLEDAGVIYKHEYGPSDWKRLETTGGRVDLFFDIFKGRTHINEQRLPVWRVMFKDCLWLNIYVAKYTKHHVKNKKHRLWS